MNLEQYMFKETPFKYSVALTELIKGYNGHAQLFETPECFVLQLNFPFPKHEDSKKAIFEWFKMLEKFGGHKNE